MALYTRREKDKERAILEKLEKVFDNTDFIDEATITIKIARSEITTFQYCIKEFITPDVEEAKNE